MIGIYCIYNIVTKDMYIGSSIDIEKRINGHTKALQNTTHHSKYLQRAWNKYRQNKFIFAILEQVRYKEDLIEREQYWIDYYNSEYNTYLEADSPLGINHSNKTKQKLRIANLGKKHTEKTKIKMSKSHKGINTWMRGRHLSKEIKRKISIANKGKHFHSHIAWNKGKKLSKEHKINLSKGHIGKWINPTKAMLDGKIKRMHTIISRKDYNK